MISNKKSHFLLSVLMLLSISLTAACGRSETGETIKADDSPNASVSTAAVRESDSASTSLETAAGPSSDAVSPDAAASDIPHEEVSLAAAAGASYEADPTADAGAAAGASSGDTAATAGSAEQSSDEPRMLKYIDAWQEWHTMEVDPGVDECVYSPDSFSEKDGQMCLEDSRFDVLQGVDVSEHQGVIDWEAVAQAGYRFAFIRVGYRGYGEAGVLAEDARAVENLRGAKEAGLQTGTYFFSQALNEEEAREEAALAVSVISRSGVNTDLPLMYDPELIRDDWGRANEITREQVSLNTAAFKEEAEKSSSLSVDIYSNLPWEHHYFDRDTLNQYSIWYADYEKSPQTPYHFSWWQYTNEGSVPGISGLVDLNIWIKEK